MPDNVPQSQYEERAAEHIRGAFLNPFRSRVISDFLLFHRTRLHLLFADPAIRDNEEVKAALRRWL